MQSRIKDPKLADEGKLKTEDWEDKDGEKRYTTKIIAQTVQFLDTPSKREAIQNQPEPTDEEIPF